MQSLNILDTAPCPKYDDITKLLCSILNVPIAQLSLVDSSRQWCKSIQGLDLKQISRDIAFCAWVLLPKHPKALVVEDTYDDARYVHDDPRIPRQSCRICIAMTIMHVYNATFPMLVKAASI